jgi:N-methylhydantoinase A
MKLDRAAAEVTVGGIATTLGLGMTEAAYGIYHVVNENMISATRIHIAERGEDPRRLTLFAFGGAGPVHACALARALKMPGYICPAGAGVASALGLLTAPAAFDFAQTYVAQLTPERLRSLDEVFASLEEQGRTRLREAGVSDDQMEFERSADMRHHGQGHEIPVDLPWDEFAAVDLDRDLRPHFYTRYETLYGHAHRHLAVEIMTCRVRATGPRPQVTLPRAAQGSSRTAPKGRRPVYIPERGGFIEVPIYDRASLPVRSEIEGPAVVEEIDSTAFVGPDARAVVDAHRNLVVTFTDIVPTHDPNGSGG